MPKFVVETVQLRRERIRYLLDALDQEHAEDRVRSGEVSGEVYDSVPDSAENVISVDGACVEVPRPLPTDLNFAELCQLVQQAINNINNPAQPLVLNATARLEQVLKTLKTQIQ